MLSRPRHFGKALVLVAALGLVLSGCAGGETDEAGTEGEEHVTTGAGMGEPIAPPVLIAADALGGLLKLTWETPSMCDEVEGERRTATTEFALVFTVPGTDTVYLDGEAYEDKTYTYRLRCIKGEAASAYSNEKTANPADG